MYEFSARRRTPTINDTMPFQKKKKRKVSQTTPIMIPKQLLAKSGIYRFGQKSYHDGKGDDKHHKS